MPVRVVQDEVASHVRRYRAGAWRDDEDVLAAEEPMETRVVWQEAGEVRRKSIAITMRTPGRDFPLAIGFLFAEGVISGFDDVADVAYCQDLEEEQRFNIVTITLRPGLALDTARLERNFYTTSSCGVCGKASLDALEVQGCSPLPSGFTVGAETLCALPAALRHEQSLFATTGGLHAAGLFHADGRLLAMEEDVGRHNALDKLIGARLMEGEAALHDCILLLSGRASFELLQKALVARIPVVASVGAPSSLAVQLAESFDITLTGFLRGETFNVYAGAQRIS